MFENIEKSNRYTPNNKPVKTVFTGMRHKKCVVCGKEFKTLSGGAKYCSDQCRNKAHKEKNND